MLAFKCLHELATAPAVPAVTRRWFRFAVVVVVGVLAGSGIFQIRSYYQDPYFDSGLSPQSNWRVLSAGLARIIRFGDVVLMRRISCRNGR